MYLEYLKIKDGIILEFFSSKVYVAFVMLLLSQVTRHKIK